MRPWFSQISASLLYKLSVATIHHIASTAAVIAYNLQFTFSTSMWDTNFFWPNFCCRNRVGLYMIGLYASIYGNTRDSDMQHVLRFLYSAFLSSTEGLVWCAIWQAFDTSIHPLAQLLDSLVDAFLATYVGIGSHLRLLYHAVDEFKSFVTRLYLIIR